MNDVRVAVVPDSVITGLMEQNEGIYRELALLRAQLDSQVRKHWYTLHEAADVKGISFEVLRKLPRRYWPNFGRATQLVSGSRKYNQAYRREDVLRWAEMSEAEIDEAYEQLLRKESA